LKSDRQFLSERLTGSVFRLNACLPAAGERRQHRSSLAACDATSPAVTATSPHYL